MKKKYILLSVGVAVVALSLIQSCATIPKNVTAVKNFQKDKYLGKWYEIARLDYRFERNLDNATAEYSLNDDGTIKVINKGYNYKKNEWKSVKGKAKFVGLENEGNLKVSFFGPFYAGYNVVKVDDDYQNALVYGGSTKYIWILSRHKEITKQVKEEFLAKAKRDGYDLTDLIWVKHDKD
ncbi:lipocalin [Pedobacter changchengzhani]|uniref:Outer membrane lipoprotein Blc n=1 Tax=Pedobacter changchengzhani TaxID=2529274 RepID=A0A4R5MN23_9SPHI|nr:lipocalin family protein [Pedobacter changchengzhani]TDG37132.1 lipocalin [Pedobacter changchengzhani]